MHILADHMHKCRIMIQREFETPDGLIDDKCGDPVKEGHAGLCT